MTPEQKEQLRRLVLRFMAERAALSYNSASVQRGVSREMACTVPEITDALELLLDLGLLKRIENRLGAARYYQITAAGTLAYESGE